MPTKNGRLTPQEDAFARAFAATEDRTYAAFSAGYTSTAAPYSVAARPGVQTRIRELRRQRLEKLGMLSLDHYERVLTDPKEPTREKTKVAGQVARELQIETEREDEDRAEWDLAPGEIRARIMQLETALQRRLGQLQDIDGTTGEPIVESDSVFD